MNSSLRHDTVNSAILNALPHPVLLVDADNAITSANQAAEQFLQAGAAVLNRHKLEHFIPFSSPIFGLLEQVRARGSTVTEYRVDISSPRIGADRVVDIYASPVAEHSGHVTVMFQPRSVTEKIDRQLTHRGAARTVTGLAAMLAHEIKNPLSGIRGAAQLLEADANENDRTLTRIICDEADRIVGLVDRMEVFADDRPVAREPVNIHLVLGRVKTLATSGFARGVSIREDYDPSLPPIHANRDQLLQVFINLVKNAAEAVEGQDIQEISYQTAFRPGISMSVPGSISKVSLPIEISVTDNGPGVPDDILPYLFDPFVTSKANGTGLGLALVAKIVGDHGGMIECKSQPDKTTFRMLMPVHSGSQLADPAHSGMTGEVELAGLP